MPDAPVPPGAPPPQASDTTGASLEAGYSFTFLDHTLHHATVGTQVPAGSQGPFVLRRLIGQGGQGEVWEAWQASLDRDVAVKIHRRGDVGAFLDEALLTGQLDHPNIVPVLDLGTLGTVEGEDTATPVMAMKRVRGVRWDELIALERDPGFAPTHEYWTRHLGILRAVCNAMAYAHSRGIVHLDLKPSQVIVGEFGEVYLMDWGVAARLASHPGRGRAVGQIIGPQGTPGYMAPEQALGDAHAIGIATDIYLLGAVAYHVAMGHAPHPGASTDEMIGHARKNTLVPLDDAVPAPLASILARAMNSSPDRRHVSVEEFRAAIEAFLGAASHQREAQAIVAACRQRVEAEVSLGYDELAEMERQLDRAQTLAPDAPGIDALRDEVLGAHAARATSTGDLELARLLANRIRHASQRATAQQHVDAALDERRARDRQRILARRVALASLGAVAIVLALASFSLLRSARIAVAERERAEAALAQSQRELGRSSLQAAAGYLQQGRPQAARESLVHAPAAQRGWEWGYLASASVLEARLLRPRSERFVALALAEDASLLAAVRDASGGLLLLDPKTDGTSFIEDTSAKWTVLYPAGDGLIIAGSADGRVGEFNARGLRRLIQVADAEILHIAGRSTSSLFVADALGRVSRISAEDNVPARCWQAPASITALAASGEGFAVGLDDGSVWHTANHTSLPVKSSVLHETVVRGLSWQPGGTRVASWAVKPGVAQAFSDPRAILHEVGNPTPAFVGVGDGFAATAATWSADGARLFVATGGIDIYEMTPDGAVVGSSAHPVGIIGAMQFSSSQDTLVSAARRHIEVRTWSRKTIRRSMAVDSRRIMGWATTPDRLYACGLDGGIGEWRWDRTEHTYRHSFYPDRVLTMDRARSAPVIVAGHQSGVVSLWHADGGSIVRSGELFLEGRVQQLRVAPDGKTFVTAHEGGAVGFVRPLPDGGLLQRRWGAGGPVAAVAMAPDGDTIVAALEDGGIARGVGTTGEFAMLPASTATRHTALVFDTTGRLLVAGRHDGTIDILDATTLEHRRELRGHRGPIHRLAISEPGALLVSTSEDETAALWDITSGAQLGTYRGTHAGRVTGAALTPDGQRLLTSCMDSLVRVFDRASGVQLVSLQEHQYGVLDLLIEERGRWLFTAGQDGQVRAWIPVEADIDDSLLERGLERIFEFDGGTPRSPGAELVAGSTGS